MRKSLHCLALCATLALAAAAAGPAIAADTESRREEARPRASAPRGDNPSTGELAAEALRRQRPQASSKEELPDDWPTDDFGRPLRSCDVPWDYVPRK